MGNLILADNFKMESIDLVELRRLYNRGVAAQQQTEQWLDSVLEEILRRGG